MKTYTRDELETIVKNETKRVVESNYEIFTEEYILDIQGKDMNTALAIALAKLYKSTHENFSKVLINVLDKMCNS